MFEPITDPYPWPLKKKYLQGFKSPSHGYRTRTGPMCCNAGCGRGRKKKQHTIINRMRLNG